MNQIRLLNDQGRGVFENGFTSMAICCLLIDTFYQFEHGVAQTTQNKVCYTDFLRAHLGDIFDTQEKANRFYTDIRCGILHSAQTKNGSRLSTNVLHTVEHIDSIPSSPITVDVQKMEDHLSQYFYEYCDRVRCDNTTQSNFVKKSILCSNKVHLMMRDKYLRRIIDVYYAHTWNGVGVAFSC